MSIPQYGGIPSQYNGVLSADPVPTGPPPAQNAPPPNQYGALSADPVPVAGPPSPPPAPVPNQYGAALSAAPVPTAAAGQPQPTVLSPSDDNRYNGVLSAAPVPTGPAAANLAPPPQPAAEPEVPKGIPNQKTQTSQPTPGDVLDSLGNWATHLGTPTGDGLAQAVAHPGDALGAAKDAAGAVLNYPSHAVREPMAGVFAKQLESGDRSSAIDLPIPTPDLSKVPGLGFLTDGPSGVAKGVAKGIIGMGSSWTNALGWDPEHTVVTPWSPDEFSDEQKTAIVSAYHDGYTDKNGTPYEAGDAAALAAINDARPGSEVLGTTIGADPTIMLGAAARGVGVVAKGLEAAEQLPKVVKALGGIERGLDAVGTFGLSEVVPPLVKVVPKIPVVGAPFRLSKAGQLAKETGQIEDAAAGLATKAREAGATDLANRAADLTESGGLKVLRTVAEDGTAEQLAWVERKGPVGPRGGRTAVVPQIVEDVGQRTVTRPATEADFDRFLAASVHLPEAQLETSRQAWFRLATKNRWIETKAPLGAAVDPVTGLITDPKYAKWADWVAARMRANDSLDSVLPTLNPYTRRPVLEGLLKSLSNTVFERAFLKSDILAHRELAGINDILKRAYPDGLDDWARAELAAAQTGVPTRFLAESLTRQKNVRKLVTMTSREFWGRTGTKGLNTLMNDLPRGIAARGGAEIENLLRQRLAFPILRRDDLDAMSKVVRAYDGFVGPVPPQVQRIVNVLRAEGITGASLRDIADAAQTASTGFHLPRRIGEVNLEPIAHEVTGAAPLAGTPRPMVTAHEFADLGLTSKFEQAIYKRLPQPVLDTLHKTVTLKGQTFTLGDRLLEHQTNLDRVRTAIRLQDAGTDVGSKLAALTDRYVAQVGSVLRETDDLAKVKARLLEMSDAEIDAMASRLTGRDYLAAKGALDAGGKTVTGKMLDAWDGYLSARRSIQLLNPINAPRYFGNQAVGNLLTLILGGQTAALKWYLRPAEWKRGLDMLAKGSLRVEFEDLNRGSQILAKIEGRAAPNLIIDTRTGQMAGFFSRPGRSPVTRAIGSVLANDRVLRMASSMDALLRNAAYTAAAEPMLNRVRRALPKVALDLKAGTTGIVAHDKDSIAAAVERAFTEHGPLPTTTELRDILIETGGGSQAVDRKALFKWASEVADHYGGKLDELNRVAKGKVELVGFTGPETNLDAFLKRTTMFHFWTARATKLYAVEAAKNPILLQFWSQMLQHAGDNELAGVPHYAKNWIGYARSPLGWVNMTDPTALLGTWLFFSETADPDSKAHLTPFGAFFENGPGGNVMLNPLMQAALYAVGAMGRDARAPDVFGTGRIEREMNNTLRSVWPTVNAWLIDNGMEGLSEDSPYLDSSVVIRTVASHLAGMLPGTQDVPMGDPSRSLDSQIAWIVRDQALKKNPALTPDQLDAMEQLALADHGSPAYQDALSVANTSLSLTDRGGLLGILGFGARIASPFNDRPVLENRLDMQRRTGPLGLDKTAMDYATTGSVYDIAGKDQQIAFAWDRASDGTFVLWNQYKADHPDASDDEIDTMVLEAIANDDPAVRDAGRMGEISKQASAIRGAYILDPVVIGGQQWTSDALRHVDAQGRSDLAALWLDETGQAAALDTWYRQKDAFLADHPDLANAWALKDYAAQYDGGPEQFVRDAIQVNPNYAQWVADYTLRQEGKVEPWSDDWLGKVTGPDGWEALQGIQQSTFDLKPAATNGAAIPGLPQGTGLAAWKDDNGSQWDAKSAERRTSLAKNLDAVQKNLGLLDTYDASVGQPVGTSANLYLQQQAGLIAKIPSGAYDALKNGAYVEKDSEVADYLAYLAVDPTGSVDGFFASKTDASRQKRLAQGIVVHPDDQIALEAKQDSPEGKATGGSFVDALRQRGVGFTDDGAGNLVLGVARSGAPSPTPQESGSAPSGRGSSPVTPMQPLAYTTLPGGGRSGQLPAGIILRPTGRRQGKLVEVTVPGTAQPVWVNEGLLSPA